MFRIPRRISDILHAAPYTGGFVVSLLETLLASPRRPVGEWGITSVTACEEYDYVEFIMHDIEHGMSYQVTVELVDPEWVQRLTR